MVREFQKVIGEECLDQLGSELPDVVVACVGGGSNSIGIFYPLLETGVELVGVEAAGEGIESGRHGASLTAGRPGVLHGTRTYLIPGRRRPGAGGALDLGRARLSRGGSRACLLVRCRAGGLRSGHRSGGAGGGRSSLPTEGIIPALESAHAIAWVSRNAARLAGQTVLVCLSGRGDKDLQTIARARNSMNGLDRIRAAFGPTPSLFPFLTAGLPTPADSVMLFVAMAEAGADGFEVGIPYSRPVDGRAGDHAGERGRPRRRDQPRGGA